MLEGLNLATGGAAVEFNLAALRWSVLLQLGAFASMIALAVFKPRRLGRARPGSAALR